MLRKPYLYILAICFFCCEEAPDFGTVDSADTPIVDIQTSETIFTDFPIEIEWEGNTAAREFIYELQYVDDPSIPHSWSGSNTTNETSMTFDNLDEGSYTFSVQGLYNQDNIGDVVTLDFTVDVISGPSLRIYPLNQTANVGDEIDVYLYLEEVPELSAVAGWDIEIQINPAELKFLSGTLEFLPGTVGYDGLGGGYDGLPGENNISDTLIPTYSENEGMGSIEIIGGVFGSGLHGTGSILTFKLRVLAAEGTSDIIIANEIFESPENLPGPISGFQNPVNGSVTVE